MTILAIVLLLLFTVILAVGSAYQARIELDHKAYLETENVWKQNSSV